MPKRTFGAYATYVVILLASLACIITGAVLIPKGTRRSGKLVAKDGKWAIEYTADGVTTTTPWFSSAESLVANAEDTLWVTEDDPSPTGTRHGVAYIVCLIVGALVLVIEVGVFSFFYVRGRMAEKATAESKAAQIQS